MQPVHTVESWNSVATTETPFRFAGTILTMQKRDDGKLVITNALVEQPVIVPEVNSNTLGQIVSLCGMAKFSFYKMKQQEVQKQFETIFPYHTGLRDFLLSNIDHLCIRGASRASLTQGLVQLCAAYRVLLIMTYESSQNRKATADKIIAHLRQSENSSRLGTLFPNTSNAQTRTESIGLFKKLVDRLVSEVKLPVGTIDVVPQGTNSILIRGNSTGLPIEVYRLTSKVSAAERERLTTVTDRIILGWTVNKAGESTLSILNVVENE